ncbi:MAG: prepilin-type N-terminal cleavage/methylation domain-containing protein [Fretibacterium sp.]|nr:prepilin-type N-terminal cleavage/methylation domain-containing protein [Fretibacterium sp.]
MKKRSVRLGFTLVELLIVIGIIGILMSGLLLSGSSATSSARALNIVSDLRIMKQAVFMMYLDSMDHFDRGLDPKFETLDPAVVLARYVENPGRYDGGQYGFDVSSSGRWYIFYTIGNIAGADEIKSSLSGRAKTEGLLEEGSNETYKGGSKVYMLAR